MHDWKIVSAPWPGIRIVRCAECGWEARRIGRQDSPLAFTRTGRLIAPCPRVRADVRVPAFDDSFVTQGTSRPALVGPST